MASEKGICRHNSCDSVFSIGVYTQSKWQTCPNCGEKNLKHRARQRYEEYQALVDGPTGPSLPTPDPIMPSSPASASCGQKFDGDKDEPGLLLSGCHLAVAGVIAVLGFGFRKYKQRNGWKSVPEAPRRYKDAMHRHLAAIERGELVDPESGKPHIDHAACNAIFLSQMYHEANQ